MKLQLTVYLHTQISNSCTLVICSSSSSGCTLVIVISILTFSEKKESIRNSNWLNTAPVIAEVSERFRMNLRLIRTKELFLGKPYMLISNLL